MQPTRSVVVPLSTAICWTIALITITVDFTVAFITPTQSPLAEHIHAAARLVATGLTIAGMSVLVLSRVPKGSLPRQRRTLDALPTADSFGEVVDFETRRAMKSLEARLLGRPSD
jgi:hypothetical protein